MGIEVAAAAGFECDVCGALGLSAHTDAFDTKALFDRMRNVIGMVVEISLPVPEGWSYGEVAVDERVETVLACPACVRSAE